MISIFITLFIGFIGWQIAKKIKLPAPAMLGSLFAVIVYNLIFNKAYVPVEMKIFTKSITGMFIGLTIKKEDIPGMKRLIKPIVLMLLLFTLNTILTGFVIHRIADIDILSAWLACIPGGVADISLLALDMEANVAVVVFMQTARLVFTLGIFPIWIKFLTKNEPENVDNDEGEMDNTVGKSNFNMLLTIFIACVCGYLGSFLEFPASSIIFAMVGVAAINNTKMKLYSKKNVKVVGQIISGSLIALSVTLDMIIQLKDLIVPMIILMIAYLMLNYVYGYICKRLKWLDYKTALFCLCPAGLTDLVLMSGELGADMKNTGIAHIVRMVYSISVLPILIEFLSNLTI